MVNQANLIDVRDITKQYKRTRALDGVELTVAPGEVVGLVGPNGAGKSTLIRILCGVAACTSGSGHVLGEPVGPGSRKLPFIGVMIEHPTFVESLDGRTNLRLLAGIRGRIGLERIDEVLDLVGLGLAGKTRVRQYSLGMRQRLSLAQAIMERPQLLVLDEPTNGLDPDGIMELRGLLREQVRAERAGVLISSHLLREVEAMCDRVVLIEAGRIRGVFRPGESGRSDLRLELVAAEQRRLVEKVEGIVAVACDADGRGMTVRTTLSTPDVVRRLVAAGVDVEALYRQSARLEEVYRETMGRSA